MSEQGNRCDRCGTYEWEWSDNEGNPVNPWEGASKSCNGCYQVDYAMKEHRDRGSSDLGVRFGLFPARRR